MHAAQPSAACISMVGDSNVVIVRLTVVFLLVVVLLLSSSGAMQRAAQVVCAAAGRDGERRGISSRKQSACVRVGVSVASWCLLGLCDRRRRPAAGQNRGDRADVMRGGGGWRSVAIVLVAAALQVELSLGQESGEGRWRWGRRCCL